MKSLLGKFKQNRIQLIADLEIARGDKILEAYIQGQIDRINIVLNTIRKIKIMKATLEFDLRNPEDAQEHLRAVKSAGLASVLFEIESNLKRKIENKIEEEVYESQSDLLDDVFEHFGLLMKEHSINLEELIS